MTNGSLLELSDAGQSSASARQAPLDYQIAVFCQNERPRIAACLASVSAAIGPRRGLITVIVNGSTDGSEIAAKEASAVIGTPVQVFSIDAGDKANAINSFLYDRDMRADARMYFFVDGYTILYPGALEAMADCLAANPVALGASGVATNGRNEYRSTRHIVEVGGVLRGQFYGLKPDFVRRLVDAGFRLPVGLYRGDGLLGSMLAHNLDPLGQPWMNSRTIGVADAKFEIDALSIFSLRDLRRQFRRKVRQMRGLLENKAIGKLIYAKGYAALPRFADDMIREFLANNPLPAVSLIERPFMALALRDHRAARPAEPDRLRPRRI
jgi:glycosyltransferase involved in cell wall biosynthesis